MIETHDEKWVNSTKASLTAMGVTHEISEMFRVKGIRAKSISCDKEGRLIITPSECYKGTKWHDIVRNLNAN